MAYDFNYFKENVSIIEVAEYLGYQHNRSKGLNNRLEYTHPTLDNIVISKPDYAKGQMYFNRFDDLDKGTVIDFVKNRLHLFNTASNNAFAAVNKVLSDFANVTTGEGHKRARSIHDIVQRKEPFDPSKYMFRPPQLSDLTYLVSGRMLSSATVNKFLPFMRLVRANHSKSRIINIGFPYTIPGQAGVKGVEMVNYGWKQHAKHSDKTNATWQADLSNGGLISQVIFGESAIDLMSFYELNKDKLPFDQSLLVGTGGGLSKNQIKNILQTHPEASVHTAFDNDLAGNVYDIKVAAFQLDKELIIRKDRDVITVNLPAGEKEFSLKENNLTLTNFRKLSGLRPSLTTHKPMDKDFNKDLMNKKSKTQKIRR